MPAKLTAEDVDSHTDPSVAKQFDTETPKKDQFQDFYKTVDGLKIGLLTTIRDGVGPVSRSMAVAKRDGPDFLFLANKHAKKFSDIENDKTAQLTFQNSSTQDWVSITGTIATASSSDPRIKGLYSKTIAAWFGDLGDGVHDGSAEDPRMTLIELKANYICYWKSTVTSLGFVKEVAQAVVMGSVATNGVQRQFEGEDIEEMRNDA